MLPVQHARPQESFPGAAKRLSIRALVIDFMLRRVRNCQRYYYYYSFIRSTDLPTYPLSHNVGLTYTSEV